jgi:hypothetical protein
MVVGCTSGRSDFDICEVKSHACHGFGRHLSFSLMLFVTALYVGGKKSFADIMITSSVLDDACSGFCLLLLYGVFGRWNIAIAPREVAKKRLGVFLRSCHGDCGHFSVLYSTIFSFDMHNSLQT